MKAWLLDEMRGLDALRLAEAPDPAAGAGEVVLDLEFAALNPADRYMSEGQYPGKPPMPHILGRDGVGIVSATGAGTEQFRVGQRLLILRGATGVARWGTFAQRVAVSVDSVARPPADWSIEQSAGASLVYLTAYQALTMWGELPPSVVLITGASGGVGVATVQLARALGHCVIALSRDPHKRQKLAQMGASEVIDPTDPQWPAQVKHHLGKRRVDLAIDNIGGETFSRAIETLGDNRRVSAVGRLAGPVPQFNTASLFFRRLRIGGVHVGSYTPAEAQAAWAALLRHLSLAGAKPLVDRVFPFGELRGAFEYLAKGPMGKVLLDIRSA